MGHAATPPVDQIGHEQREQRDWLVVVKGTGDKDKVAILSRDFLAELRHEGLEIEVADFIYETEAGHLSVAQNVGP